MKNEGMYCLDDVPDDYRIYGGFGIGLNQEIGIIFHPCNVFTIYTEEVTVPDECIPDLDQMKEYLGSP